MATHPRRGPYVPPVVRGAAVDGDYRYALSRYWTTSPERWVLWVMVNPSTADAYGDDQTLRKIIPMSKGWGYHGLFVVNLFAFRAAKPAALIAAHRRGKDVIGPHNDEHIKKHLSAAENVVVAWGNTVDRMGDFGVERSRKVLEAISAAGHLPMCVATTSSGQPGHPLLLPVTSTLTLYEVPDVKPIVRRAAGPRT